MSARVPDYVESAALLRGSLEDAADALGHADLERLLACEMRIHAALTHLSSSQIAPASRLRLADEIARARDALGRCRRLGQSLNDFVQLALGVQGLNDSYGRSGSAIDASRHTIERSA
jgi:hypothetical protein